MWRCLVPGLLLLCACSVRSPAPAPPQERPAHQVTPEATPEAVPRPDSEPASCRAEDFAGAQSADRVGHALLQEGDLLFMLGGYSEHPERRCVHPQPVSRLEGAGRARPVRLTPAQAELARWGHSATWLAPGRALILGGTTEDPESSPWEAPPALLLDLAQGRAQPVQGLAQPSAFHQASRLPDGSVLVTGGAASHELTLARVALRTPQGTWAAQPPMTQRRQGHTATALGDGRVLVVGGVRAGLDGQSARDCAADEDCARGTWCHQSWSCVSASPGAELRDGRTGAWRPLRWPQGSRAGHTATHLPGGDVLVVGGRREDGALSSVWRYLAGQGRWVRRASLDQARHQHSALWLPQGKLLVAGGWALVPCQQALTLEERQLDLGCQGLRPKALSSTEVYDPTQDRWTPGPALSRPRAGHRAALLEGRPVLIGGRDATGTLPQVEPVEVQAGAQP